MSALAKKKEEVIAEIEVDPAEISKITIAWDEFVGCLCLSDKSKEYIQEEMERLAQSILNFEEYFVSSSADKNEKVIKVE